MTAEKKVALVLEGGSMRGMFTAGVLDILMDEEIHVDGIIGVSAGALFGPNYFSKQRGRVIRYNKRFCKDKRNMSFRNFLLTGNLVSKQFAFYDITLKYDLFDNEAFIKNNTGYYATVTNVETGKAEYIAMSDIIKEMEVLRATAAIPFVSQMVELNGKKYLDGGIGDSIPVLKAKEMGYEKIIVVLTRPLDYRKEPFSKGMLQLLNLKYGKYPQFIETMKNRYKHYNETVELIQKMENDGELFVIRPSEPITLKTIERNPDNLQRVYELGLKDAAAKIPALQLYLEKE